MNSASDELIRQTLGELLVNDLACFKAGSVPEHNHYCRDSVDVLPVASFAQGFGNILPELTVLINNIKFFNY